MTHSQIRSCLEACERIVSSFIGGYRVYNRASGYCVMAGRGKLEFIKLSPRTLTEVKCMEVCCGNTTLIW